MRKGTDGAAGIPLPASVPCELIQRALERGHYLTEVQRHEEQVKAAPVCWLPWNYREQLVESLCNGALPLIDASSAKARGRYRWRLRSRGRLHLHGIPANHAVLRASPGDHRPSSGPRIACRCAPPAPP